jgi:hypothetical protein
MSDDLRNVGKDIGLLLGLALAGAGLAVALGAVLVHESVALPLAELAGRGGLWAGLVAAVAGGVLARTCARRGPTGSARPRNGTRRPTTSAPRGVFASARHAHQHRHLTSATCLALLACAVLAETAPAAVLCQRGHAKRLMLRADCRASEHAVDPAALGLAGTPSCVDLIGAAREDVRAAGDRLRSALALAVRLGTFPGEGGETLLVLHAALADAALASVERRAGLLGMEGAAATAAAMRRMIAEEWVRPAYACSAALDLLPTLEASLPVLPAE